MLLTFPDTPVGALAAVESQGPWDPKAAADWTGEALDPTVARHRLASEQSYRGGQKQANNNNK